MVFMNADTYWPDVNFRTNVQMGIRIYYPLNVVLYSEMAI